MEGKGVTLAPVLATQNIVSHDGTLAEYKSFQPKCYYCLEAPAVLGCHMCHMYLCAECDKVLHKHPQKRNHTRFVIAKQKSVAMFDMPKKEGETAVVRNPLINDRLVDCPIDKPHLKTLSDLFWDGIKRNGKNRAMGFRPIRKDGTAAGYKWITYNQLGARVKNFGSGLANLGLKPLERVGILSQNRTCWVVADQAILTYGMTTVPLYDTYGPDAVEYVTNDAELVAVVCSAKQLDATRKTIPTCPHLRLIIVIDDVPVEDVGSVRVVNMRQVEADGEKNPQELRMPHPDDIATICYTSGTTGNPKGAMLSHRNFVANLAGADVYLGDYLTPEDRHISYLPLAHQFERIVMCSYLNKGVQVGFFQGDVLKLLEDVQALQPTIFCSVPRVLNRIYDRVGATVAEANAVRQWLFNKALEAKKSNLSLPPPAGTVDSALWDRLVFKKVQAVLGGRVRLILTGSAPIAGHVLEFLRACFACQVIEGYGMTESCSGVTLTPPFCLTAHSNVGVPAPCVEIKLVDVPDMNYRSTDAPNPRGEICLRGPTVTRGYLKKPEITKETIDEDGWLHTGDVGTLLECGSLKIIDRKKNIFKLQQGEYIAPEKVENIYVRSPMVAQAFVHGDSFQTYCVGVVVPDIEVVGPWAKANGVPGTTLEELCKSDKLKEAIMKDVIKQGEMAGLKGFEQVKNIHLSPELFTPESGILTPTFKLKRPSARAAFEKEIVQLYENTK